MDRFPKSSPHFPRNLPKSYKYVFGEFEKLVFIKVPFRKDFHKYPDEIVKGWYTYIAPNNFSPGHYKDGKFFYMLYIDIENEKIYAKKLYFTYSIILDFILIIGIIIAFLNLEKLIEIIK